MSNDTKAEGLVQTWILVTDKQGRAHLEAHWANPSSTATHVTHAA